jgi:hypothetical protein
LLYGKVSSWRRQEEIGGNRRAIFTSP